MTRQIRGRIEGPPQILGGILRAICLRRRRDVLVPAPTAEVTHELIFTSEERRLYESVLNDAKMQLETALQEETARKGAQTIMLASIMRLRRICTNGTFSPTKVERHNSLKGLQDCDDCMTETHESPGSIESSGSTKSCWSCGKDLTGMLISSPSPSEKTLLPAMEQLPSGRTSKLTAVAVQITQSKIGDKKYSLPSTAANDHGSAKLTAA